MKLSCKEKAVFCGVLCFCGQAVAMEQPEPTATVGFNEELAVIADDVFAFDTHKQISGLQRSPSVLVILASQQDNQVNESSSGSRAIKGTMPSIAIQTDLEQISEMAMIGSISENDNKDKTAKNDKDETLSNHSSEQFSAEIELGKKGSCCHCKTRFKSKTLAKYAATAVGGFVVAVLAL